MNTSSTIIFGLDEVGRGPLAGPVLVCAVVILNNYPHIEQTYGHLPDSKGLSSAYREQIADQLMNESGIEWTISQVSSAVIDRINILQATKKAMTRAVKHLERKLGLEADLLLIDGNFSIPINRPQRAIVKGDISVLPIKIASIIAKVKRDQLMNRYHLKFPLYGFNQHKGYGTTEHYHALKKHGPCPLHRRSFRLT